jgi:octaprenyl-diphosphate synthase
LRAVLKVADIKAPIAEEMKMFEGRFKEAMKSSTPLLDKISHYIIKRKGKQMRPMFVFLSAKTCGEVNDSTYTAASMIELLHTATLVHDDVVDDSNVRRGFFSINALWKNKIAVLVGDYLLSRGLLMSVDGGEFALLGIISKAVKEMSEGELLQIEKARRLNITEDVYFDIIRQKTASLISACCEAGASSVDASKEMCQLMAEFGTKVGIAFQIKDDLFDYGAGQDIGKPTGIDIKERKLTWPLIHALNQSTKSERRSIVNIVKNHNENPQKVEEVMDYVRNSGGIDYTVNKMNELRGEALELLFQMPASDSRSALEGLVNYTINRTK